MTQQVSQIVEALWTERGLSAQIRVRMPAEHAERIDATQIPTYINGGGKAKAKALLVSETREPVDSGAHLLWFFETSGGALLHRCNP